MTEIFQVNSLWWVISLLLIGLLMGSFISMLSWRLPNLMEADTPDLFRSLVLDRSRCDNCQTIIPARQLIPIVSWLINRGKSHCCQQPIGFRYPLIEITTALLTTVTAMQFVNLDTNLWEQSIRFWGSLFFVWALIAISIIDFEHQLIPDRLSLPLLWLGLLMNTQDHGFINIESAVWGAAFGYMSLWLIFQIHRALTGKEGMGYGDFKLTAALGAWLGIEALMPIFIIAGGLAIVVMGSLTLLKKHELAALFPFGPWLATAGILLLLGLNPLAI